MTLAATHLAPSVTIAAAVLIAVFLVAYWVRLARVEMPRGRKLVRRLSLALLLLSLPNFVRGLSYLDPSVDRTAYVVSWSVSILLMLVVFFVAFLDGLMTMRDHRVTAQAELTAALLARGRAPQDAGAADDAGGGDRGEADRGEADRGEADR